MEYLMLDIGLGFGFLAGFIAGVRADDETGIKDWHLVWKRLREYYRKVM